MSFAGDTRDEMVRIQPTCDMCNKACVSALMRIDGTFYLSGKGNYRVELATDFASVGRFIVDAMHKLYNLKTEISYRRSVLHHTQNYQIDIPYQENLEAALSDLGILGQGYSLLPGANKALIKNKCCKAAYLRGAFLGAGFISDPKANFHFEIIVNSEQMACDLSDLMKDLGISSRIVKRRQNWMIYMKSGNEISKFLACVGAHESALRLEDVRVIKSLRNDVNRSINAELANQNRASKAAYLQLSNINKIIKANKLSQLSPAISEFVKLRVKYPEASLKELGDMCSPPLSKSAINHRARRLEEFARGIDEQ